MVNYVQYSFTYGQYFTVLFYAQGAVYPCLQKVALRLLVVPASSASSERVFSKAGFIITLRRNQLAPPTVDAMLFLQQHKKKMRKRAASATATTSTAE